MPRSYADVFLEAILENPDDDTPRLVYADWLDEQGDSTSAARAEFIRVQCTLARDRLPARRRMALETRQQRLIEEHGEQWARPLCRLLLFWNFHRGFIDKVTLRSERFLAYAGRLFRRAPIQHLRLIFRVRGYAGPVGQRVSMSALVDIDHLRRLHSLDLYGNQLESDDVRALVVSKHLTGVTSLNLAGNRIGDRGIRALAESPLLAQLMHLNLSHNHFGATGVRALAEALEKLARGPKGLRMRNLDLSGNNLGTTGRRILANSRLLKRLVRR